MQEENNESFLNTITQTIFDKKGFNIITLDVRGICSFTDYFVIAEGNVDKHVKAIAREIKEELSEKECYLAHLEGMDEGGWVVLDYVHFIVHLFVPKLRERYSLEEIWQKGKILELMIETGKEV
jgi:ribosome-associated protein